MNNTKSNLVNYDGKKYIRVSNGNKIFYFDVDNLAINVRQKKRIEYLKMIRRLSFTAEVQR